MLTRTFRHIPGIGPQTEARLWARGVASWDDLTADPAVVPASKRAMLVDLLERSRVALAADDAGFFGDRLKPADQWRLFANFPESIAYVDIETTGARPGEDAVTTIALYDGRNVRTYIQGENLLEFCDDIEDYKVLCTFNGRCFDAPVLERCLGARLPAAHIDLRCVMGGLGYKGGLKKVEKVFGVDRAELDGVDGYFAVVLWNEWERTGNRAALETLAAYNVLDVLGLEVLLREAFNLYLEDTPFYAELACPGPHPVPPANPHVADIGLVEELKGRISAARQARRGW
jgi:hypothetical protein